MTRPACIHCGRGLIWRAGSRAWVHERNASAWCDSPSGTIAEVTGKGDGRREADVDGDGDPARFPHRLHRGAR